MYRNPISPKRLEFLTQLLNKKLQKTQPQLLPKLLPKLQHLAAADPSPSGEYSSWILNLLIKRDIDLPEDAQKLNELLETFHRVKRRLPIEFRDINRFNSYSQLRITLLPMLPTLKSVAELELEGNKLITTQLINEAVYQLYEITNSEAAAKAAKNSGWCVCNKETAASYLKDGALYLIMRDDERFALGHVQSNQLMDVEDVPVNRSEPNHYYDDLVILLQQYVPALICPKHTNGIKNRGCKTCEDAGCEDCGFVMCENKDESCTNEMCKKHAEKCVDCGKYFCDECTRDCCRSSRRGEIKCKSCSDRCNKCDEPVCDDCSSFAECCGALYCQDHIAGFCEGCSNSFCGRHENLISCHECSSGHYCEDCREDWIHCPECGNVTCDSCNTQCDNCASRICSGCEKKCNKCDKDLCDDCSEHCRTCDETYCPDCETFTCEGPPKHHAHGEFSYCEPHLEEEEAEDYFQFCDECIDTCFKCDVLVCGECSNLCGCGRAHTLCEKCKDANVCTVCGELMCIPQEHIQCAYIRRRRYR